MITQAIVTLRRKSGRLLVDFLQIIEHFECVVISHQLPILINSASDMEYD